VTWLEQDCAGFVLVQLSSEGGDFQLGGAGEFEGYFTKPNLLQGPVFSPDGRYAVAACSRWSWWAPGGDPETPSPGGRIKAGHVAVLAAAALAPGGQRSNGRARIHRATNVPNRPPHGGDRIVPIAR
jgi:hypothetical protein